MSKRGLDVWREEKAPTKSQRSELRGQSEGSHIRIDQVMGLNMDKSSKRVPITTNC